MGTESRLCLRAAGLLPASAGDCYTALLRSRGSGVPPDASSLPPRLRRWFWPRLWQVVKNMPACSSGLVTHHLRHLGEEAAHHCRGFFRYLGLLHSRGHQLQPAITLCLTDHEG
jgi:hypothetical protein